MAINHPVRVHFVRAINVGGTAKLPMAELRELAAELGAQNISSYINSGNLLASPPGDPAAFDRKLEQAIESRFGFFREVISRSVEELAAAHAAYPFEVLDPAKSLVAFLAEPPAADRVAALAAKDFGSDQWELIGSDLHISYADSVAKSKLSNTTIASTLGVQCTSRNLKSMAKLLELSSTTGRG